MCILTVVFFIVFCVFYLYILQFGDLVIFVSFTAPYSSLSWLIDWLTDWLIVVWVILTDEPTHKQHRTAITYEFLSERCLVVLWQVLLQRQNDAVCDDRQQHHVLERRSHAVKDRLHCAMQFKLCKTVAATWLHVLDSTPRLPRPTQPSTLSGTENEFWPKVWRCSAAGK